MDNSAARKFERKVLLIVAIIVVIGTLFLSLVNFIANFLWFKEMEYLDVFFKQLVTQLTVGVPTFVIVTVLVYLYLNHLRKGYFKQIASVEDTNMKMLKRSTVILSVIFGIGATFFAVTQLWFEILKFANSTGFNIQDPLFQRRILDHQQAILPARNERCDKELGQDVRYRFALAVQTEKLSGAYNVPQLGKIGGTAHGQVVQLDQRIAESALGMPAEAEQSTKPPIIAHSFAQSGILASLRAGKQFPQSERLVYLHRRGLAQPRHGLL